MINATQQNLYSFTDIIKVGARRNRRRHQKGQSLQAEKMPVPKPQSQQL